MREDDALKVDGYSCIPIPISSAPSVLPLYIEVKSLSLHIQDVLSAHFPLQRLKEMKQMSRDPLAAAKARKAERRADEKSGGITIKPVSLPSTEATKPTGFKKGGFKNAFGSADDDEEEMTDENKKKKQAKAEPRVEGWKVAEPVEVESDEDWGDYDPRRPTGCWEGCPGRR